MKLEMEIICIGNELLIGKTLNTNAQWLAKQATTLGIDVKRITVAADHVNEIALVIRDALQRKPRFIITTGGLGPTFDDKTLEGIAKALELGLEVNKEALGMIIRRYEAYFKKKIGKCDLTLARVKMATLPKGATPLPNPAGTAPGVMINLDKTHLVALPGVPPEMEAIFEGSIAPALKREAGKNIFFEKSIYVERIVESALAPLIDLAMSENPEVYIKSHVYVRLQPDYEGKESRIELHLSTTARNAKTAENRLEKAAARLADLITADKGKVAQKNI